MNKEDYKMIVKSFMDNGKYGFINNEGEIIISSKYTTVWQRGNYWFVWDHGKMGIVNEFGEEIVPCEYKEINECNIPGQLELMRVDEYGSKKYGIASIKDKKILAPAKYDKINPFKDGVAEIRQDVEYGVVDESGHEYYYGVDNVELVKLYYKLMNTEKLILKSAVRIAANKDEALMMLADTKKAINAARTELYNINKKSKTSKKEEDLSNICEEIDASIDRF